MPIIPLFSSGVVFKNLLLLSNENVKNTILPEIISGEKIGTYCVYENDKYLTSSDEISTTLTKDKNGYILNGQKKICNVWRRL